MSDLALLQQTFDALNIYYTVEKRENEIVLTLEEQQSYNHEERRLNTVDETKVKYVGYTGFAWLFGFDHDGKTLWVGGYE